MNRRLCVWVVSILTCAFTVLAHAQAGPSSPPPTGGPFGGPAGGPAAPPAPITPPPSVGGPTLNSQALASADATPFAPNIREFIKYHMNVLAGDDTSKQPGSRDAIRKQLARGSTPSYYAVFAKEWSDAAIKVISKTPPPPMGVRLNIAIITSVLADNGQTMDAVTSGGLDALETLDTMLLADSSGSVGLWGLKAAKPIVQIRMMQADVNGKPPVSKIEAAIVNAVKTHLSEQGEISGFLTQDAYLALKITDVPGQTPAMVKDKQPLLIDPLLDILDIRVGSFKDGKIPVPGAEREVATFLSGLFSQIKLPEQKRMVQLMVNLEVYGGQRFDLYNSSTTHTDVSQMRETLKYVASALKVIANDRNVDTGLSWFSTMPLTAEGKDIIPKTKAVPIAMQQVFKWVVNPPEIPVIEAPAPVKPAPAAPAGSNPTPAGN